MVHFKLVFLQTPTDARKMKITRVCKAAEILLLVCLSLLPSVAIGANEGTASNFTFALVAKNINNPFFSLVKQGCVDRALHLSSTPPSKTVSCRLVGPEKDDALAQADIIDALINGTYGKIDGISVSVADPDLVAPAINRAVSAGIPTITFDSDAEDSERKAYVGTDNEAFGEELGKLLEQLAPEGGKYGVLAASAPNVVQRFDGVKKRLAVKNKWTPVSSHDLLGLLTKYAICQDCISFHSLADTDILFGLDTKKDPRFLLRLQRRHGHGHEYHVRIRRYGFTGHHPRGCMANE